MQGSVAEGATSERAGFWRRVFAFLIDAIAVSVFVVVVGILLYALTHGAVRISNSVIAVTKCRTASIDQLNLKLPGNFVHPRAAECVRQTFGMEHDRFLEIVAESRLDGTKNYFPTLTIPINEEGTIARVLYLDWAVFVLLAAYFILLEWRFGQTLGKRLLGIRVNSLDGTPVKISQTATRTVVRLVPFIPIIAVQLSVLIFDPVQAIMFLESHAVAYALLGLALPVVFLFNFIGAVPWHDRWAGTVVVRAAAPLPKSTQMQSQTIGASEREPPQP